MTRAIILEVAARHGVDPDDLHGPSRLRRICRARWEAMRLLRARGLSSPMIGRMFNRDHTSVLYALRKLGG